MSRDGHILLDLHFSKVLSFPSCIHFFPLLIDFFFREALSSQNSWVESTENLHILQHHPVSHTHTHTHTYNLPNYQHPPTEWYICYNWWAYIDTSSPPSPQFTVWVIFLVLYILYVNKRIMTWTDHCSIIQNSSTALKILHVQPTHPSNPHEPSFYLSLVLPFPKCQIVVILQNEAFSNWLLSLD